MPTTSQISLLLAAVAFFAIGGVVSVARLRWDTRAMRIAGKSCLYWGMTLAVAVLIWHSIMRGRWVPIGDNFDALIWLAVLLSLFAAYVQGTRPLPALDWFIMPIVIALLVLAAVFGRVEFHPYIGHAWTYVHRMTSYVGAVAFAIAAASGAMYVGASARLRQKHPTSIYLGSLERLERLTMTAVTLGFALLTIGIITGAVEMIFLNRPTSSWKIALTGCVWLVYAVVLHAPLNPIFRGRRAAVLSVLGFALMLGTLVAVQFGSVAK